MPVLNVVCPICTDVFQNSDDIYSTSCGHIFHYACMNDWRRQGTSCPQCRQYNPTTHKLYLSFDELEENTEKLDEIQLKLRTSQEKVDELLAQMAEAEKNFMDLHTQFTNTEKSKRELEQELAQRNDWEHQFLSLQAQFTQSSELTKDLEDQIHQLFIENECKSKELRLKIMENETLKANLEEGGQSCLSDSVLDEKVKMLEQKLKHISKEFEKEITTSTQLSIEKIKLQSMVTHLTEEKTNKPPPKQNNNKKIHSTPNRESSNKENNLNNRSEKNKKQNVNSNNNNNNDNPDCVFINDLPLELITVPLESIIVNLASKMHLSITSDDLIKANLVNNEENPFKAQLFAQFKSSELKTKFFANKMALSNDPSTKFIRIGDFNDEKLNALYLYTQKNLRNNGFSCIYCTNNKIFAKRSRSHSTAVCIETKAQVDELRTKKKPAEPTTAPEKPNNVDEYLYQLY